MGSHHVVSRHPSSRAVSGILMAGTSSSTLFNALENGGPAGLIYGYLFVWCGAILQALVMAEMASMYVSNSNTLKFHCFFCFSGLLCHNLRRIWISFRYHPHDSFFFFGEHAGNDPFFRVRNMLGRKAILPRDCDPRVLLQVHCGHGNGGHISSRKHSMF